MKSEPEIRGRLEELDERMSKCNPVDAISIDAQRFALQWVLGIE